MKSTSRTSNSNGNRACAFIKLICLVNCVKLKQIQNEDVFHRKHLNKKVLGLIGFPTHWLIRSSMFECDESNIEWQQNRDYVLQFDFSSLMHTPPQIICGTQQCYCVFSKIEWFASFFSAFVFRFNFVWNHCSPFFFDFFSLTLFMFCHHGTMSIGQNDKYTGHQMISWQVYTTLDRWSK